MELGVCTGPPSAERAARLVSAGCEYYEPSVAGAVMVAGRDAFTAGIGEWAGGGLAPRSANVLLPGDLAVVGEERDDERLAGYLAEAFRRAHELGLERVVFGSGTARNVPEGFDRDEARRQFADTLRLAAADAKDAVESGGGSGEMLVCLEHLRRAETNLVNSLAEAGELAEEIGVASLVLVVDGYHLEEEGEDPAVVRRFAPLVRHVHVCGSGRVPPRPQDGERLRALFGELAAIGYEGRCSIECRWTDIDEEAPAALAVVRAAAEATGLA
ncbi:MAG: sugar phosphate isomerase/epimerase family protein [Acidimicrobiales bacterium]